MADAPKNPFAQFDGVPVKTASDNQNPFAQFDVGKSAPAPGTIVVTTANGTFDDSHWYDPLLRPISAADVGRSLKGAARGLTQGAAAVPDIILGPLNYLTGGRTGTATQIANQGLDAAGVTAPSNPSTSEDIANAIYRGVGGGAATLGVGGVAANAPGAITSTIGRSLVTNPGAQIAAATTGSSAAELAKQGGAGPGGQLLAGFAGGLVPSAAGGTVATLNALRAPLTEAGQQGIVAGGLNRLAGGAPLSFQASPVPGVERTLAESTANPGIAAAQRVSLSAPENTANASARAAANNTARQNYLTGAVGTPETTAALVEDRATQTRPLYNLAANMDAEQRAIVQGQADQAAAQGRLLPGGTNAANASANAIANQIPDQVKPLLARPAFQQAVKDAADLLAERGKPGVNPLTSVEGLQAIKTSLDNAINKAPTNTAQTFDVNAVRNTRALLVKAMQDISPAQREADTTFAQLSGPINAQQVGQAIVAKGSGNLVDPRTGLPLLRPNSFAGAMDNGDAIAQQVTGQKNATLSGTLTPEQQAALGNVRSDLERVNFADTAGAARGSATQQNLLSQKFLEDFSNNIGIPGLSQTTAAQTVAKSLDQVYKLFGVPDALKARMTEVMLNPTSTESQAILARIPQQQRQNFVRTAAPYAAALRAQAAALQQPQPQAAAGGQ